MPKLKNTPSYDREINNVIWSFEDEDEFYLEDVMSRCAQSSICTDKSLVKKLLDELVRDGNIGFEPYDGSYWFK